MQITADQLHFFKAFISRPSTGRAVLETWNGDLTGLLNCSRTILSGCGLPQKTVDALTDREARKKAESELKWYHENGIEIISHDSAEYPALLKEIPDFPSLLFRKGKPVNDKGVAIAVIGTREPTPYGLAACRTIIRKLAETGCRPVIISGLATGMDSCAHKSALEAGLETVAVMGTPPERTFPASGRELRSRIEEHGCTLTEFPKGSITAKWSFLQRNRIIAALSSAVIVVESGIRGGAMNTAALAMDYNREVFAVPGRVGDSKSEGCNRLIARNCATILDSMETLFEKMNCSLLQPKQERNAKKTDSFEKFNYEKRSILLSLGQFSVQDVNGLHKNTGFPLEVLVKELFELEIQGIVRRLPGNGYCLNELLH